jgi:hypothetical protein
MPSPTSNSGTHASRQRLIGLRGFDRIAYCTDLAVMVALVVCGCEVETPDEKTPMATGSTTVESASIVSTVSTTAVGTVGKILTTAEKTIDSASGVNLTETSATAFQAADGTWEMFDSANSAAGRFDYSCTANNYTTWCTNAIFLGSGGASAAIGDTNSVSAQGYVYAVSLRAEQSGFWFFRTKDPCPGRAGVCQNSLPWDVSLEVVGANGTIDFPDIIKNPINDDVWIVYRRNDTTGKIVLARFQNGQIWNTNLAVFEDNCAGLTGFGLDRVRAAFDSSGNIHIVYQDFSHSQIKHEIFSTATNTYQCKLNVIGPYALPAICGCGFPGIPGPTSCLRSLIAPSITIDQHTNPNILLVAYETPGSNSCANKTETRIYRSTNGGTSWTFQTVTGCQTAVQPRIAFPNQVGEIPGVVQMMTTYNTTGLTTLSQVAWRSADFGVTWSGTFISPERTVTNLGNCYSGDYNGIAPDSAHGSYFYSWSQLSGANWVNRGLARPQ